MKIKMKKQMTYEEYAKHLIDKFGIASYEREIIDNNIFDAPIEFEQTFTLNPMRNFYDPVIERSFKGVVIEVEEEITEHTVIPKVLNVFKNTTNRIRNDEESHIRRNVSVKEIKENSKDYIENDRLYVMNDDLTMELIWTREKGMVE